jgi:membrane-associated phospholipid phosphatase
MSSENALPPIEAESPAPSGSKIWSEFWTALVTAVTLSVMFFVVYGGSNWVASQRSGVGTWYYQWERWIPFVPIMIVPYMSIDLFFFAAPFFARQHDERRLLAARCALAMFGAAIVWLAMPLKLAVERPHVDGWLGTIYNNFVAVDQPHNLLPSLHIGLRTILADFYAIRLSGLWLIASHVWFSLIGFSTLLTYQHHVVDVVGGFVLAAVCLYLVQPTPIVQPVTPNRRIGAYYAGGTLILLAAASWLGGWAAWLLWPATATGLVATGYFGFGPGVYRKHDGKLPLSARILLAPVLLGQRLSLAHYKRQCHAWDEVVPGVWIGRVLSDSETEAAIGQGVTAVLDLAAEFSEVPPFRRTVYRSLAILDLTAPTAGQLREAVAFISEQASRGTVYVHCKIGYSRSAAVVAAYLMASGKEDSAESAISHLRRIRPGIVIRQEAEKAIRDFQAGYRDCPSTKAGA